MRRRTKAVVGVLALGGLLSLGGFLAGPSEAGASEVDDPVSYQVGDLSVFFERTRNFSCSVSRVVRNDGPVPLLVIVTAEWDGMEGPTVFPQAAHSPYTEPTWLQPGEQTTAVWSNHGFLPDGEVRLLWSVLEAPGTTGWNRVEFVPACRTTVSSEPAPTVPPSSAPPVTDPPSVTAPGPDTTTPPPSVVSGPAPSDPDVAVETSSVQRELPNTGADAWPVVAVGFGLLATGWSLLRGAGRLTHGEDAR